MSASIAAVVSRRAAAAWHHGQSTPETAHISVCGIQTGTVPLAQVIFFWFPLFQCSERKYRMAWFRFSTFKTEAEFKFASNIKYQASLFSLFLFLIMAYPLYSSISDFDLDQGFDVENFAGIGQYSNTLTHCGTNNYLRNYYNSEVGWGSTSRTGGYTVAGFFVAAIILFSFIPRTDGIRCLGLKSSILSDIAYYLALGCLFMGGYSFLAQGIGLCWGSVDVISIHLTGLSLFFLGGLVPGAYFTATNCCLSEQSVEIKYKSSRSCLSQLKKTFSNGKLLILRSILLCALTFYEISRIVSSNESSAQSNCREACSQIASSGGLMLGSTFEKSSTFFYCGPLNLAKQMLFFNQTLTKADLENPKNRCLPAFVGSSVELDKWYSQSAYVTCSCSQTNNISDGRVQIISQYLSEKIVSSNSSMTGCDMGGSCLGVISSTVFITASNIALNFFPALWTILIVWRSRPAVGQDQWDAIGPKHLTYSCRLSSYAALEWGGNSDYSGGLHLRTWLLCINIMQALIFGVILGWTLPDTIRWEAELCLFYSSYLWFDHRMTMLSARARARLFGPKLPASSATEFSHSEIAWKDGEASFRICFPPEHTVVQAFCETESLTAVPNCTLDADDQAVNQAPSGDVVFPAFEKDAAAYGSLEPFSRGGFSADPHAGDPGSRFPPLLLCPNILPILVSQLFADLDLQVANSESCLGQDSCNHSIETNVRFAQFRPPPPRPPRPLRGPPRPPRPLHPRPLHPPTPHMISAFCGFHSSHST